MNNPVISIVLPVYNAEKTINDTCDSIISQTYQQFEVIAVDDGSTDNSLTLLKQIAAKDNRFSVIHTDNHGVCGARNTGMDHAAGEYLLFVDADDMLFPKALERLYRNLTRNNCDISAGRAFASKAAPNMETFQVQAEDNCEIWEGQKALSESLKSNRATFSIWARLFKRDLLTDIRFAEGRAVNEDSFFFFCCFLKHPKMCISEEIVYWYNSSNASNSQIRMIKHLDDALYFLEQKKKLIEETHPDLTPLFLDFEFNTYLNILDNICLTGDKSHPDIEKSCVKSVRANMSRCTLSKPYYKRLVKAIRFHAYPLYKKIVHMRFGR